MAGYVLKTDHQGSHALDIQQALMGGETHDQIVRAGLKAGMHVWEYGCGNGATTLDLARIVGPGGHVTPCSLYLLRSF